MAAPSYQLVMRSGPTPGKVYELSKSEIFIGRDVTNDIVINDAEVSRKHARLTFQAGGYVIEDLGSTNGTFVGGQRLMGPHALRLNELVMFGEHVGVYLEQVPFDPDATVMAGSGQREKPAARPAQPAPAVKPVEVAPAPAYSGQIPAGPAEPDTQPLPEEKKGLGARVWLLAGCGCLILMAIAVIVVVFVIDYFQLWCTIFGSLVPGC